MVPVMHIGFDFVVRNLPPPTIGYDFDSKCTVSHVSDMITYIHACLDTSSYIIKQIRLKFVAQSRPNRWTEFNESCPIG